MKVNSRKVAVIGCGFVGSSSAFALMQSVCSQKWFLLMQIQKEPKVKLWI